MSTIGHVMILASAGSGKTYALTNRFVRLLALGAAPDRIVALTFTRKAAGEFFDEILKKLARAASEAAYARQLAAEIGWEEMPDAAGGRRAAATTEDFLKLLRAVVDAMHRLRLGTFDGFFAWIARSFPLELGLTGDFEVLQEHAARRERAGVLRRMFAHAGELAAEQREFIEAFKRATFGGEEKRLGAQLDAFLDEHQEIFLAAPDGALWGDPQRIWPQGNPWLDGAADKAGAAAALRTWVEGAELGEKQRVRWRDFLEAVEAWAPGVVPSRPLGYVLEKALAAWAELSAGRAVLEFDRKKQELSPAASRALAELTRHVVGGELRRRIEMTRGVHAVLAAYEAVYHDAVRRTGKLSFGDVQRLLLPDDGGPRLSATAGEGRLAIDYRLDGEIDHWLLDEFQDTSAGQWAVLKNLIDEAVQDPTGARSFFYVGDVKQAIYAWREGDPRLFREIFDHYNAAQPGAIAGEPLTASWRSGPAVIAAVNRVFGDAAVLSALFPRPTADDWNKEWQAHTSAKPQLGGHVALLHADDEAGRFAMALAVLQEIEPLERGLSCALLVQKNETASALADYLRREGGLPAVAESDLHVCTDNPLGAALLALVQAAAHPGDSLAQAHVNLSPLGALLAAEGLATPDARTRRLLARIHAEGFERALAPWVRRLETVLAPDDAFSRLRARQWLDAAAEFDATGSRDAAEFVAFMERHTERESETAAVLRVMTIHKSKGLGFDVVVLPDLEGKSLAARRDGLAVQKTPERTVEWILDLPTKLFYEQDAVLAAHVRAAEADTGYEKLSLLYVAMTRAKRAMYLVTKPPGTSESRNFPRLLAETLGAESVDVRIGRLTLPGAYAEGDADWHGRIAAPPVPPPRVATLGPLDDSAALRAPRWPARLPSSAKRAAVSGAMAFSLEPRHGAEFGTAVHALFAAVEWGGAAAVRVALEAARARGVAPEVVAEAEACLAAPGLTEIWAPPTGLAAGHSAEVWRERAFELVLDGAWITGIFDRVIVVRDATRRVVAAQVIDFKTDRADDAAELAVLVRRHAPQVEIYRRAAAVLTGLAPAAVEARLVFTRLRQVARV